MSMPIKHWIGIVSGVSSCCTPGMVVDGAWIIGSRITSVARIQVCVRIPDLKVAKERLVEHGATMVHLPVKTPWCDRYIRFQDPPGIQLTLFQTPDQA